VPNIRQSYQSRRQFIAGLAAAGGSLAANGCAMRAKGASTKPIRGTWFEFQHHNTAEGIYWNPQCAAFDCSQWEDKVREMAEIGLEYVVLMETALYFKAFYETGIFPRWELACHDPIERILSTADRHGVKIFMGGGFYGDWMSPNIIGDPNARRKRLAAIEELTAIYGGHKSFYGWYWPNEAFINKVYSERFIAYVNECSSLARSLKSGVRTLIAPYGTRVAVPDDTYVRQLESLDIDIIAYQDEVGVRKSKTTETAAFYEGLRRAHNRVPRVAIWADMEIFEFEGETYRSALLPAHFERVEQQIAAISPFVDTILVYQYLGMLHRPGSPSFAGHPGSTQLSSDYVGWLKTHHPEVL